MTCSFIFNFFVVVVIVFSSFHFVRSAFGKGHFIKFLIIVIVIIIVVVIVMK